MISLLSTLFYPFSFLFSRVLKKHNNTKIFLLNLLAFPFILFAWIVYWGLLFFYGSRISYAVGIQTGILPTIVNIAGTGSMYPTFPKGKAETAEERSKETVASPNMWSFPGGIELFGTRYFGYRLGYGDIVDFSNESTQKLLDSSESEAQGFVKRVIGLPNDTIEIRDGFVFRNGEQIKEQYIAKPRSTFGGKFLPDCTPLNIPADSIFVLGDNRKASNDSRHDVGLVNIHDVSKILPFSKQTPFFSLWRDPNEDEKLAHTPVFSSEKYLEKLNEARIKQHAKPLRYQSSLERSANLRASKMLETNDLSFEATRSGYTMEKAMKQVGYSNIVWGESPVLGYYTEEELLDSLSEFPSWKDFFMDPKYQEIGISAQVGEMNGCPVQIVVQHLAGYVPPNYSAETVQSWIDAKSKLEKLEENWVGARQFGGQYEEHKEEYEKIIALIHDRLTIVTQIADKMQKNQWLSEEDKELIKKNDELFSQQEALAKRLNESSQ